MCLDLLMLFLDIVIDFSQNGFNQKLIATEPTPMDFCWSLVLVTQYKTK